MYFDDIAPWEIMSIEDDFDCDKYKQSFDLLNIIMLNDLLTIILKYLDFRDLLKLKIASKKFHKSVDIEINQRNKFIKNGNSFRSNINFWFMGRNTCICFSINGVHNGPCNKWEEIVLLGGNKICRSCHRKKREATLTLLRNQKLVDQPRKHKFANGERFLPINHNEL